MNIKDQKGISGVDITVSIVLITIFITLATMVSGRIIQNKNRASASREALSYAISEIENLKKKSVGSVNSSEGYIDGTGFYQTVTVTDAKDVLNSNSMIEGKLKKATVEIRYKEAGAIRRIELSAMIY